jgi:hypothetical protein
MEPVEYVQQVGAMSLYGLVHPLEILGQSWRVMVVILPDDMQDTEVLSLYMQGRIFPLESTLQYQERVVPLLETFVLAMAVS